LLGSGFADNQISPLKLGSVQRRNRPLCLLIRVHFNESETFGSAAEFIGNNPSADHRSVLREMLLEPIFRHGVG
jgi:hypothetical protein